MDTDPTVRWERERISTVSTRRHRIVLPPEAAATLLAVSTVLLGALLEVPTFGIFLGWAAAGLAAHDGSARSSVLGRCLVLGALCATATLGAQQPVAEMLGEGVPSWVSTIVVLAIANPLLILLGRSAAFSSVPGMFIGFSTVLAVYLVDAAPISGSILGALLVGAATNLTGLGFHWLNGLMTGRHRARRPGPRAADPTLMK